MATQKDVHKAILERFERERARVREEEFFGAREGAETVAELRGVLVSAFGLIEEAQYEHAIALLEKDG